LQIRFFTLRKNKTLFLTNRQISLMKFEERFSIEKEKMLLAGFWVRNRFADQSWGDPYDDFKEEPL